MKKITLIVPDALVASIVQIITPEVSEFRVESIGAPEKEKRRRAAKKIINGNNVDQVVMRALPATVEQIKDAVVAAGFGRTTAYGVIRRAVSEGRLAQRPDGVYYTRT